MNPVTILLLSVAGFLGLVLLIGILRSIRVVPAQTALVIERLGKYSKTLEAGFHMMFPFLDKVKYKHSLKEQAFDVPSQPCFTKDNVKVEVDGVLYFKVISPKAASYGIRDYKYATMQLAQTTMRSVMGKLDLDSTFEERETINASIVKSVDEASDPWGVKVTRYEVQNIHVPPTILKSMEVQMKAERERRAEIARSEGVRDSKINYSLGVMEEAVNKSTGQKERMINEAEGKAQEIRAVAHATAESIRKVAAAMVTPGGRDAVKLQLADEYITEFSKLAGKNNTIVLPMDLTDVSKVKEMIAKILE